MRGQVLSDDTDILRQLSGYTATHADWTGAQTLVGKLSHPTGRRIALTTETGHTIADSAAPGTALPARASATVDPLATDTYTEPGAQLAGIDPRAAGPYHLTATERAHVKTLAQKRLACMRRHYSEGSLRQLPSGRTVVIPTDGVASVPEECANGTLNAPTPTEQKALAKLTTLIAACVDGSRGQDRKVEFLIEFVPGVPSSKGGPAPLLSSKPTTQTCIDNARHAQLDPYVAPRAKLYLGDLSGRPAGFDLSPTNKAKITSVSALVLAFTVAMTTVVAIRLLRPLRALTVAAQQPPHEHARVAVITKDETGYLAAAFNDLTARREQLEAQRKAMVSDIAHELRTPLTNIRGWLEVTRDGLLDVNPDLIAALHDEALLLQHIIDDLRDLATADAGTLQLHREPIRTDELVAQAVSAHSARAESSGIRLHAHTDPGLWLDADPVRMRQALGNLISNALRHTPAGGTVTVTAWPADDLAVLSVEDTGSGIAAEDLPHVFERFWRAEKSRSRHTGGSGLGLSIVRQLVEEHGGTVTADSSPGDGAVFTLWLPRADQPDGPTA
ncbi:sensor histidine kinase [Streptomyces sp. NPDC101149]|uniref:sensor histidine kinase n=1 Tax=Streptomyces sp. NPDC101149 TaxID=3366113 RepID=UPI0038161EAF